MKLPKALSLLIVGIVLEFYFKFVHKKWPKSCLFCFFFINSQEVENRDYEHCKSILGKFRWNVLTGLSLTVHTVTDRYFLQNWWFQHYSFHWVIWVNFTKPIWTFENPSFVQSIKFPNFFKKWDFLTIFIKQSQFCKVLPPWDIFEVGPLLGVKAVGWACHKFPEMRQSFAGKFVICIDPA